MERIHQGRGRSLEIATSSLSFEASTPDETFLPLPEGAVSDMEGKGIEVVEEVGEDAPWDLDLGGDDQHQFSAGEDDS
jgi:hypothetical protein